MASVSHRISIAWPPAPASEPTSTIVLTTPKRRFVDLRALLPLSSGSLYWGIAGTSSYDAITRIGRWNHIIDSRTDEPTEDSGVMSTLENGDVLEKGRMIDFDDGNLKPYEEVWRDEDVTGSGRVLAADCTSKGFKGLVVILGNWCQALVKSRDGTFAGRWTRTRGGGWKNVFMVGEVLDTNLPVILESATGEEVVVGFKWTVVETAVL